jgi:2-keto-4-pentenoate hydratase/2-oxohepta-3-ene-1,7-dioic acid hydratase in catechol pathway
MPCSTSAGYFADFQLGRDFGRGNNFDRTGSFVPWMVTANELPDAGKQLKIENRLNGGAHEDRGRCIRGLSYAAQFQRPFEPGGMAA